MLIRVKSMRESTIKKEIVELKIAILKRWKVGNDVIFKIESVCEETTDYIKSISGVLGVELEKNEKYSECVQTN